MPRLRLVGLVVGIVCLLPALVWAQGGAVSSGTKILLQKDVPITITKPGSYQLGSNLKVTNPNVTAITVAADNVTIDLAGFTIEGPLAGEVGYGAGIMTSASPNRNYVLVRNGVVRGFYGVALPCVHLAGHGNRVEDLRVDNCPFGGIYVGTSGVVTRCQVSDTFVGIGLEAGSMAVDNVFYNTTGPTINVSGPERGGTTIKGNNCRQCGICVSAKSLGNLIKGNVITGCDTGLDLTDGASFYDGNLLYGNDNAVEGGEGNIDGGGNVIISGPPVP
jgi:hypothetical protein